MFSFMMSVPTWGAQKAALSPMGGWKDSRWTDWGVEWPERPIVVS